MLCEGRALADDMKVPQSGSHVQVRLRGVGGMHPGFATPNEIEEALREEAERKGTAQVPERAVLSASADTCRYSIPLLRQTCLLTSSGSTRNGSCSEATETTDDRDLLWAPYRERSSTIGRRYAGGPTAFFSSSPKGNVLQSTKNYCAR